jgi:hypothetical protein
MSVVTEHIFSLIAKQVEDHKLVVWYDPDKAYSSVVDGIELPKTTVARYGGSFFHLRREIDGLMNGLQPPRLVVYVPQDQASTDHALVELEAAGVVMQPGQQPPPRNTRLAVVARNALKPILGEETAAQVEKNVDAGKLTLAELDALADQGQGAMGVVSLIFGTVDPQEVALVFLASEKLDQQIEQKSAAKEIIDLFRRTFELDVAEAAPLAQVREQLGRHVLLTDLIKGLAGAVPTSSGSVKVAHSAVGMDACLSLTRVWRLRRDVRETYVTAANKVEQEFSLAQVEFDPGRIVDLETFLALDRLVQWHVEQSLIESPNADLLALAQSRVARFWSDVMPPIQARWALVVAAARVLLEAERVAKAIKKAPATVPSLVKAYTDGEAPWCLLDTYQRQMESRWYNYEPELGEQHDGLDKLILKAQERYTEVGSELAKHFVEKFQKAKHSVKGVLRQVDVFGSLVKPRLDQGKTAYVWVDALRFEMAKELCEVLAADCEVTLEPAIAAIPSITEIGMAALLPRADQSAKVVSVGGGKLGLEIEGSVIKDRKDRIAFVKQHAGVAVFDAKLEDLLPKPSKKVRDGVQGAQLVLVTSQEIDELCEQDNIAQARRQMDGILNDLRRGIRVLSELGVKCIVLAADHGHLFGEEVSEDMKIEAPGGDTADLHRRVWIGVGGTVEPSYLRTSLASLGMDSEFDIATPWTLACFKAKGGARAYFHGGLSPQELVIPVATIIPTAQAPAGPPVGIDWKLTPGSPKITTRFFSVQVAGAATGLFELEAPKVRLEIRAKGKVISNPVSASYGYEDTTGEVALKVSEADPRKIEPNTITVMVNVEEIAQKSVGAYLIDANSGAELKSLDKIEVAISIR